MRIRSQQIEATATELHKAIDAYGLLETLQFVFGDRVFVSTAVSKRFLEKYFTCLNLSEAALTTVVAYSEFTGGTTIEALLPLITNEPKKAIQVRGVGKRKLCNIKSAVLLELWNSLDEDEREDFCVDILESNISSVVSKE
jgi:hypothetical protein